MIREQQGRRGWLRWLGIGTAGLALVVIASWTQRGPIVENFIGRELNRRGVQARYDLVQVGLRTQRIENILLGDPRNPDLTAKWVEIDIAFAGVTPQVAAIRASGVRLKGRYLDGVLNLGELDRFRDPQSQAPFVLPDLVVGLADARVRLDTDVGPVGVRIDGSGNVRSGFTGKLAAVMPRGRLGGCGLRGGTAWLDVAVRDQRPHITGPLRAEAIGCRDAGVAAARPAALLDMGLGKDFDRWNGHAVLSGEAVKAGGVVVARPDGRVDFDGTAKGTSGRVRLAAGSLGAFAAEAGRTEFTGAWQAAGGDARLQGRLSARDLRMRGRDPLGAIRESTRDTPVGPLAARLADAVRRLGADNTLQSTLALVQRDGAGSLVLTDTQLSARSGARIAVAREGRATIAWPGGAGRPVDWALDGNITTQGGGLPHAALRLARRPGGGFGGQMFLDPYAAENARLALEPVRFVAGPRGDTRFSTHLRLDGPLPDGYVRGLSVPVEGYLDRDGGVRINPRCVSLSLQEARYGAFTLGQARQSLCPVGGGPLLAMGRSGLSGGARMDDVELSGRSDDSPMRLAADSARITLGDIGFTIAGMDVAIGPKDAPVRLTADQLTGRIAGRGLGGAVTGAGGRIGAVPLIVEDAAGHWGFAGGVLTFKAAMAVRDAQAQARFHRLSVPDFALTMRNGMIAATGTMQAPRGNAVVAKADIAHDLSSGRGRADLNVPGLIFGPALQPEEVTPLALGVVANVDATVRGEGHIRWTGSTVTSDGVFRTDNAALAAAFGPVSGLSGELRFTDLLGMVSAPGQVVRIGTVHPGIEVRDGIVRYQLKAGQRVHIEGGEFPFSGGQLLLLPTTMDFSADVERYMTFRVVGLDAGAFFQALEFENVSATGTFDG
ncbi:MAG: YdbH domain-containing protein, partial [Sphingobium sp.]